jgi:hypothetical protein
MVWDAYTLKTLRKKHRVVGTLIGIPVVQNKAPKACLPALLMPEQVVLL